MVARGKFVFSEELARQLLEWGAYGASSYAADVHAAVELSPRELQVLRYLAEGYSTKETAERLFLSMSTVRTYKQRLKHKLGLKSVTELARYAVEQGYVV